MNRRFSAAHLIASICILSSGALGALLPGPPHTPSPPHNATNVATTKILTWRSDGASLGYDVYFGTSSTPPKVGSTMVPSYTPAALLTSKKYFFRVVGKSPAGTTTGPVWDFTTAPTPDSQPVDCVVSAWTLKSWTAWSACTGGVRTRTETWTRTVIVPPQNGGKACGPLTEQRNASQSCSPPPPSPGGILLKSTDLVYEGAFRVPVGTAQQTLAYGGTALAYNPAHNSLLVVGHDWYQRVGEISIPTPVNASAIASLPRATVLQAPTDVLNGKLTTIDGNTSNGVKIGGLTVLPNSLVVSAWSYYDAGPQKQTRSHFATGLNFASLPSVLGPLQVGIGFQDIVPTDTTRIAGFVSGYMAAIPAAWQTALGGTHLTGQGGGIAILTRTSSGPSATVFTPAELGVANSPSKLVMGYPSDSSNPSGPLNHPSLGIWGVNGGVYNGTQSFRGMVFPVGTRSVLFFGWGGPRFCYGPGTADKTLDLKQVPGEPPGVHYCYDPADLTKGTHGYPYRSIVFAYDADDFLAVKYGLMKPWDVVPYAVWNFSLPFQQRLVNGADVGNYRIVGAAYDPAARRLFLSAYLNDGTLPLIHVFKLP